MNNDGHDPYAPSAALGRAAAAALDDAATRADVRASGQADTLPEDDLMGRVVHGAHQAIDELAETAGPHVQRLQQGWAAAQDTLATEAGAWREAGDDWAETLRTAVRDHPLAALAAALAVGLLLARLTER